MTRKEAIFTVVISFFATILGLISVWWYKRNKIYDLESISSHRDLIDSISETIIPKTDSPGAKDAEVVNYIMNVVENCFSKSDKRILIMGLNDVEQYCYSHYSSNFINCQAKDKVAVLTYFENQGSFTNPLLNKIKKKILGSSFFEQIKWLIVSGYCVSRLGATQGLAYDHIPVTFIACMPYALNQKSWATK